MFKIDSWAQCEKCSKWRRTDSALAKTLKTKPFVCRLGGSTCQKREEKCTDYITLPKIKA